MHAATAHDVATIAFIQSDGDLSLSPTHLHHDPHLGPDALVYESERLDGV